MSYQYISYIWLLIISSVITFFLGAIVFFGQRRSRRAYFFVASMIALTIWSLPNAFEIMGTNLQIKLFWGNVQYFAYCYSPLTLVALCMDFTGYDRLIRNKKLIMLAILPTIIILLVWTNSYHGLIRYDVHLDLKGPFHVVDKKYGIAFYVHAAYSYFLNITALLLLIRALFIKRSVYLKQTVILLIGSCLIIIPNMIYVFGLSPFKLDITPIFFGPAGLITMWAIYRYKLFELIPIARTTVIETMNIGVMVLDMTDKVIDMNPAFMRITGVSSGKVYDTDIEEVCKNLPELVNAYKNNIINFEFTLEKQEKSYVYEALFNHLRDKKGNPMGRIAMVYDITDRKQVQEEFLKHQRVLAGMEEKERLARDLHDNLGQLLGFINLQAQGIHKELSNAGVNLVAERLEKLIKVTQEAHSEIREYISQARAAGNITYDLVFEIKSIISLFEYQAGINVDLDLKGDLTGDVIRPYMIPQILNIIKEALNNISKHADAGKVEITVHNTGQQLLAIVTDNGKGFDCSLSSSSPEAGFGLNIIHERAYSIGGQVHIQSEIGKGTRVLLSVPLTRGEVYNAD